MDKYTASNGVFLNYHGNRLDITCSGGSHPDGHKLSISETSAVREFFQAERDEELGRWRWPENPDYLVYIDDGEALVVSESDPRKSPDRISRRYCEDPLGTLGWGEYAARAYFEAHPERKPWHDAKPGEVWLLTVDGAEEPLRTIYDGRCVRFYPIDDNGSAMTYGTRSSGITAGRRIWPESD